MHELNRLGILVDVSHLNDAGFWDVVAETDQPLIASHSNCRALCSHPRNLEDRQIEAVAATGGLVAITFVPKFVSADGARIWSTCSTTSITRYKVAGPEHVGLGSDFDGGGTLIPHAGEYPQSDRRDGCPRTRRAGDPRRPGPELPARVSRGVRVGG